MHLFHDQEQNQLLFRTVHTEAKAHGGCRFNAILQEKEVINNYRILQEHIPFVFLAAHSYVAGPPFADLRLPDLSPVLH